MPTCWFKKNFHMLNPLCECFATTSPWWRGLSAWDNLSFNGQLITWAHSQVVNILLLGLYTIECFLRAYVERAKYPCNRPPKGVVMEKGLGWEILSIWEVAKTVLAGVPGCTVYGLEKIMVQLAVARKHLEMELMLSPEVCKRRSVCWVSDLIQDI